MCFCHSTEKSEPTDGGTEREIMIEKEHECVYDIVEVLGPVPRYVGQ